MIQTVNTQAWSEKMLENIRGLLLDGGTVEVSNYLHATRYNKPAHADLFRLDENGRLQARHGKNWLWIDCGNKIQGWK